MPQANDSSESILCIKCKYDLRATPCASPCPECGTPAEQSKLGYRVEGEYLIARARAHLPCRSTAQLSNNATRADDRPPPPRQAHIVALKYCPRLLTVACFTLPFVLSFIGAILVSDHEFELLGHFVVFLLFTIIIADILRTNLARTCRLYSADPTMVDVQLKIARCHADEYWIRGFSSSYLDRCARERERMLTVAAAVE